MMWYTSFFFKIQSQKAAFKIVDADGSGSIDFHELKVLLGQSNFWIEGTEIIPELMWRFE